MEISAPGGTTTESPRSENNFRNDHTPKYVTNHILCIGFLFSPRLVTFYDISSTIQDKISFLGGRGSSPFLDKKHRGGRVRGPLRELEALLSEQVNSEPLDRQLIEAFKDFITQNVAFSAWRNSSLYQIMFAGGTIANVWLNKVGDLERITFDKVC